MGTRKSAASEFQEQMSFCKWMDRQGLFYFAVPNGGFRTVEAANKAKLEGLKAGVPDLAIILEGGGMLWIEMKRRKGGTLSPVQKAFHEELEKRGHDVFTCKGVKEAVAIVTRELKL